jgi:homoserine kinase type II
VRGRFLFRILRYVYDALLDEWDLPRPRAVIRAEAGISNDTFFVRSAAGEHVLRLYSHLGIAGIRFEHEILRRLVGAELPFRVPVPLATSHSDTVALDVDSARNAALFPRIPGVHLDDHHIEGVARAASAFATLDMALSALPRTDSPAPSFSGDLEAVHPAVTDLAQLEPALGAPVMRLVTRAAEIAQPTYASLPTQLIHGDFAFGNILMRDGRVRGVLDFEFVGRDVRAMELAGGLALMISKSTAGQLWRPYLRGYLSTLPLDPAEIAALPALALVHVAIVVVWWAGRWLRHEVSDASVTQHVERALAQERWLEDHAKEVIVEALHATS